MLPVDVLHYLCKSTYLQSLDLQLSIIALYFTQYIRTIATRLRSPRIVLFREVSWHSLFPVLHDDTDCPVLLSRLNNDEHRLSSLAFGLIREQRTLSKQHSAV